ncbi:MAG: PqqD family protein [Bacteroidales bacterium]|nr:PqqD family protein [Bacteroidales bacterium]
MRLKRKLAISENGFIFDPTTGESYSTNNEGAEIIQMLNQQKSDEEIKKYFLEHFEVDEANFERSYLDFISMLRYFNLVEDEQE